MQPIFNFTRRKVGGIWFIRLGRFQMSFCLCRCAVRSAGLEAVDRALMVAAHDR